MYKNAKIQHNTTMARNHLGSLGKINGEELTLDEINNTKDEN